MVFTVFIVFADSDHFRMCKEIQIGNYDENFNRFCDIMSHRGQSETGRGRLFTERRRCDRSTYQVFQLVLTFDMFLVSLISLTVILINNNKK